MPLRSRLVLALALLFCCWSRPARAERELIVPFHEGGHLVLDQLTGLSVDPTSGAAYSGALGVAVRTQTSGALTPGGATSETSTTSLWLAPAADVFVTDHLSVGGRIEVRHTWGAIEGGGQRLELPGTTSMTFLPRVGFYVPFGDRLGLWPRVGAGWTSHESVSFVSTGSPLARDSFHAVLLDVDVALVYRFGETFFMRAGPAVGLTLGGRRSTESGGSTSGASGSVLQFSGLLAFGMNIEL